MWLRTGNVNVTNGSAVVNGGTVSPMFITNNVLPGYAFNGPDGRRYEVLSVQSETQLTLQRNYIGTTASNQAYEIEQNTGAAEADTKQRINELLTIFRTTAELTTLKVGNPTEEAAVAAFLGTLVSLENSGNMRLRVSKGMTGNGAWIEFAVGLSGRARIGCISNNDIVFQTSADGSTWSTRMTISAAGVVSLQGTLPIGSGGTGAASAAAARTALAVPGLADMNTFTGSEIIENSNSFTPAVTLKNNLNDAGTVGPIFDLFRARPAGVSGDVGGAIQWSHNSDAGAKRIVARMLARMSDAGDSSYAGRLELHQAFAGAMAHRWNFYPSGALARSGFSDPGGQVVAADGFRFPITQIPSADPNLLDDYEEGNWTPAITFGGAAVDMAYANQIGRYIKIGRLVVLIFSLQLSAKGSSTGNLLMSGLPFTAVITSGFGTGVGSIGRYANMSSIGGHPHINVNSTTCNIWHATAAASVLLNNNQFTDTSRLDGVILYEATA